MSYSKLLIIFILVILVLFLLILNNSNNSSNCRKHKEKFVNTDIDIVITWVESNPEFQKERDSFLDRDIYQRPSEPRYSQHEELKYLLRSIEKHFPNYNKIYLVVKDGQFPSYLKKDNKRLQVVNHSEIIPKENLPTFNSRAIEMYLHHIPNLSEHYLYANDDFIITQDIDKSYYFDNNNNPYVLLTNSKIYDNKNNKDNIDTLNIKSNGFMCGLHFNSHILNKITKEEDRYEAPHNPMMYKKSNDYAIEKFFKSYYFEYDKNKTKNAFDRTGAAKFRRCDDLYLTSMLKPYLYKNWYNYETKTPDTMIIHNYDTPRKIDNTFVCLEDITDNNFDKFTKFMTNLFPEKSSFEI